MQTPNRTDFRYSRVILVIIGIMTVAVITLGVRAISNQQAQNNPRSLHHLHTKAIPEMRSVVPHMKIVSATIEGDPSTDNAMFVLTVRNDSEKGVTAYRITTGTFVGGGEGGIGHNPPLVIIKPHDTETWRIPIDNIAADTPLILASAEYEDGTQEGLPELKKRIQLDRKAHNDRAENKGEQQ